MNHYIAGSGDQENLSLSECFTHDEAIENYRLFLCYYAGTREFMLHGNPSYRRKFLTIARVGAYLLHFHYDPNRKSLTTIDRLYNAPEICQSLRQINEYRKTNPFYLHTTPTERAYLDLFVEVLLKWIGKVLPTIT